MRQNGNMIDFHIRIDAHGGHGMLPSEAVLHASRAGFRAAGLVVRSDGTYFPDFVSLGKRISRSALYLDLTVCVGVELVHVPPALIPGIADEARSAGAGFVMVYGETLADEVAQGTNFAAVEAGVDIISNPGLVDEETAKYAAEKGVALEFSGAPAHALANAHVAAMASRFGCPLVPGSSAKQAMDVVTTGAWKALYQGAALSSKTIAAMDEASRGLLERLCKGSSVMR